MDIDPATTKYPRLFIVHPAHGTAVEYPKLLEDPLDFAPELLLLWARRTILYQDVKQLKNKLNELNESYEEEKTEEAKKIAEIYKKAKEELKVVKEKHDYMD